MKRLVDELEPHDRASREALRLLRHADPLPRRHRARSEIWQRLGPAPETSRWPSLRPYVLVPLILFGGTGALAALDDGEWIGRARALFDGEALASTPTSSSTATPAMKRDTSATDGASATDEASARDEANSIAEENATDATAHNESTRQAVRKNDATKHTSPRPARAVAQRVQQAETKHAPSSEESRLLVEALRARRAGDDARAAELAKRYQSAHPNGALAEEALALSIESAMAKKSDRAAQLGRNYLARYPSGRFRALAQQAVRSKSNDSSGSRAATQR